MKNIIIVNAVNLAILLVFAGIYIFLGAPPWYFLIFAIWLVYMIISNVKLVRQMDNMYLLRKFKNKGLFISEIEILEQAVQSVDFYNDVFSKYEPGDAIRDVYDETSKRICINIDKAIRWLECYNYENRHTFNTSHEYIINLANDSKSFVTKMTELVDMLIRVDDTASDTDMCFVDDILQSLREVLNENE